MKQGSYPHFTEEKTSAGVNLPVVIPVSKKTPGPFGCPQNLFEMDDRKLHSVTTFAGRGIVWELDECGRRSGTF